jgi:glucosamine-6-phosphate deaminase
VTTATPDTICTHCAGGLACGGRDDATSSPRDSGGLIQAYAVDKLRVEVHDDATTLAHRAAAVAAGALRRAVEDRGVAHAMFATGNSQRRFVEALVAHEEAPWHDVVVFHMDEYVGVGPDHPAGFQRWIRERIVEPTTPRAAHYLDGLADPADECDRYGALLRAHPLDLCCLGIGENGHLAFNDPPVADFEDPLDVKVVELDAACRAQQVHEGHFPTVDAVPGLAMTVTIPALLRAGEVVAVVPEARKADPVRRALLDPVSTACPASALRRQANAVLLLDDESSALLDR